MEADDTVEIDRLREVVEKLRESLSESETLNQYEELPTSPSKIEPSIKETVSSPALTVTPKNKDIVPDQVENETTEIDKQYNVIQDYDSKIKELQDSLQPLLEQITQLRESQTKAPTYFSDYQEKIDNLTKQMDSITENSVQLVRERNISQAKLDKILQFVNEKDVIKELDPSLAQDFDKEIKSFKADISPKEKETSLQTAINPLTTKQTESIKIKETKILEPKQQDLKIKKIEPQKIEQPKFILTGGEHGEEAKQTNLITGETAVVPRAQPVFNDSKNTSTQTAAPTQAPITPKASFSPNPEKQPKFESLEAVNNKDNKSLEQKTQATEKGSLEPRVQPVIMSADSEQSKEKITIEPPELSPFPVLETTSELPTGEKLAQVETTQDETSAEILANTEKTNIILDSLTKLLASFIQTAGSQSNQPPSPIPIPTPSAGGSSKPGITDAELASGQGIIPGIRSKFVYTV